MCGKFYRDRQGRIRFETKEFVSISDPVARESIFIDLKTQTVNRRSFDAPATSAAPASNAIVATSPNSNSTSLGTRTVNGVQAVGREDASV